MTRRCGEEQDLGLQRLLRRRDPPDDVLDGAGPAPEAAEVEHGRGCGWGEREQLFFGACARVRGVVGGVSVLPVCAADGWSSALYMYASVNVLCIVSERADVRVGRGDAQGCMAMVDPDVIDM